MKKIKKILILFITGLLASCNTVVYPTYNEPTEVYDEYIVTIENKSEENSITIINNDNSAKVIKPSNDLFLVFSINIERISIENQKKNHYFDKNDFKLRDYGTLEYESIDAVNDYSWVGKFLSVTEEDTLMVSFDVLSNNNWNYLEVDFSWKPLNGVLFDIKK